MERSSRTERYQATDMITANSDCGLKQGHQYAATCPNCAMTVMLHCSDCKSQVTGCVCTEVDRFGEDQAWQNAVARWGDKVARERMKQAGFWTPDMHT